MGSNVLGVKYDHERGHHGTINMHHALWIYFEYTSRYNHGGGYQYRLCPLEKMPCTEEDFQEMPLEFVRDEHAIVSYQRCYLR